MKYVQYFDILGVNTAQIPCIELPGPPNAATEGAVGLLGMDMTSEDKEVYICTAVNGAIYTWKSLKDGKDGVCVRKAEVNDKGELVLTMSDGTILNAGVARGEKGADGLPGAKGQDGKDGVGISKVEINTKGELVTTYSDNSVANLGKVVGTDGVGISKVESGVVRVSNGYTVTPIIVTKTNGATVNLELRVKNNIIELNNGVEMSFFIGTQDEWNSYTGDKTNVIFFDMDDSVGEALEERLNGIKNSVPKVYLVHGKGQWKSADVAFQFLWYSFNELSSLSEVLSEMSSAGALFGVSPISSSYGGGYPCSGLYKGFAITSVYKSGNYLYFMLGRGTDTSVDESAQLSLTTVNSEVRMIFNPYFYEG